MSWLRKLLKNTNDFVSVMEEAGRMETEHWKAKGWAREAGRWVPPDGAPDTFLDGPGSIQSITSFVPLAAKKLEVDISEWGNTIDQVRAWFANRGA